MSEVATMYLIALLVGGYLCLAARQNLRNGYRRRPVESEPWNLLLSRPSTPTPIEDLARLAKAAAPDPVRSDSTLRGRLLGLLGGAVEPDTKRESAKKAVAAALQ